MAGDDDRAFDDLTRLAALVCGTPAAAVLLAGGDCLVRTGDATLEIASTPLVDASGATLGRLVVLDREARTLTAAQIDGLAVIGRQIVAQLAFQRRVAEGAERFELVARATNDAVWDWDLVTNRIWWSEGMRTLFGYPPEDVPTIDTWAAMVHPDDEPRVSAGLYRAIESGTQFWSDTYRYRRHDGSWADILDRGYVLHDASGKPVRMIGAMLDVSERRRLEEQLRQSQKMDALGQLSGGIAHDFNNLLTVIQVNAALLARSTADGGIRDHTAAITEATQRAATLTRQLLMVSRRQIMQPRVLDVNEVVTSMTRMLQRIVGEHVTLVADTARDLPLVHADTNMLEQVLLNLVVNARDAMPKGGKVTIKTGTTEASETFEHGPGPYVCVSVSDTGTGITAEHLPHIFEPFFTTKDVGRGTGLGLATAYGIVRQHRGWIEVASEPGSGTRFTFYLPATAEPRTELSAPSLDDDLPTGTETILVVEDEAALRNLVVHVLAACGYTVLSAASGIEALAIWARQKAEIQLVLTDIVMPGGLSGRELAERLRADVPGLPVVYTSGYSSELTGAGEQLVEGVNFLQKPYQPVRLARAIRARLDSHHDMPTVAPMR